MECSCKRSRGNTIDESIHYCKSHQVADGVDLRMVSDVKPNAQAIEVESDLDDLYLYHFNEEGDEA